jgi:hypothetical protein
MGQENEKKNNELLEWGRNNLFLALTLCDLDTDSAHIHSSFIDLGVAHLWTELDLGFVVVGVLHHDHEEILPLLMMGGQQRFA